MRSRPHLLMPPGRSCGRRAATLIELVVVCSVISLLAVLTLSAVQQARQTALRLSCTNKLKQIGLALSNYAANHQFFPAVCSRTDQPQSDQRPVFDHYYSPFARMLGELEQVPLYNSINFTHRPTAGAALQANSTAMMTRLDVLLCPADPPVPVDGFGRSNYRFNYGPSSGLAPGPRHPDFAAGPFAARFFYRPADFLDGLSNTVGASERTCGDWTKGVFRQSGDYFLSRTFGTDDISAEDALARCQRLLASEPHESRGGESWFLSGYHFTAYNHVVGPNPRTPDCAFGFPDSSLHYRFLRNGVIPARSQHPGCVNVLLMDGSVRTVSDGISREIWRSLATRASGDIVGPY